MTTHLKQIWHNSSDFTALARVSCWCWCCSGLTLTILHNMWFDSGNQNNSITHKETLHIIKSLIRLTKRRNIYSMEHVTQIALKTLPVRFFFFIFFSVVVFFISVQLVSQLVKSTQLKSVVSCQEKKSLFASGKQVCMHVQSAHELPLKHGFKGWLLIFLHFFSDSYPSIQLISSEKQLIRYNVTTKNYIYPHYLAI